uniref:Uncharacterized protein n=1 Tax=Solanum lycopersicum TaxID=4081 RepID=A0A3Q7GX72_SOLLC
MKGSFPTQTEFNWIWIRVNGLPLPLWSDGVMKEIGDRCGVGWKMKKKQNLRTPCYGLAFGINALCMAFYARSEEVRQTHSVHKLALQAVKPVIFPQLYPQGVLALEDALSRGLPIQKELENLHTSLEGIDNNSLLDVVLSSLPEETQRYGSDTFDTLKGTLRHFSLIPPGGGGILTHSLASVASWLKVREAGQSGDGIESLINKVESFLAQGKLSEAADALEKGLKDTHAAEIVDDWVKRARNRAITEQALTLLQSYATTIST